MRNTEEGERFLNETLTSFGELSRAHLLGSRPWQIWVCLGNSLNDEEQLGSAFRWRGFSKWVLVHQRCLRTLPRQGIWRSDL